MTSEFGNHNDADISHTNVCNYIKGIFSTPTSDGDVNSISAKVICDPSIKYKAAIYAWTDWSADYAGALLGETEEYTSTLQGTAIWLTMYFDTAVPVVSTASYYLVVYADCTATGGDYFSIRYSSYSGGARGIKLVSTYTDGYPDPMTGELPSTTDHCIYATYEPTGSGAPTGACVKKGIIRYTGTQTTGDTAFMAEHFDLVDLPFSKTAVVQAIKTITPAIKAIGYWDLCSLPEYGFGYDEYTTANNGSHEQWFIHDKYGAVAANRIYLPDDDGYKRYQMMSQPTTAPDSWADYMAYISATLVTATANCWDGVFVDEVFKWLDRDSTSWNDPPKMYSIATGLIDESTDMDADLLNNWANHALGMCTVIQNKMDLECSVGQRIVMLNEWKWTDLSENSSLWNMWEHFIHGRSSAYNDLGYNAWYTRYAIDKLRHQALLGNTIAALSGCAAADAHPTESHNWQVFTLACFLFSVEDLDTSYFFWQFYNDDSSHGYFIEMDTPLGPSVGSYYLAGGVDTFAREFTNYYVVANFSHTVTAQVEINGELHDMLPRRGKFILKGGAPQPPPPPPPPVTPPDLVPEPTGACTFVLQTITGYWVLNLPETLIYADGRSVNRLNLWASNFVSDAGKLTENITLTGYTNDKGALNLIDVAMDRGDEIQINGFDIDNIDGTWLCESFKYGRSGPGRYSYSLTLERVR